MVRCLYLQTGFKAWHRLEIPEEFRLQTASSWIVPLGLTPTSWSHRPPPGFGGWITAPRQVQLLTFKSASWEICNAFLATCNTIKLSEREKKKRQSYLTSQLLYRTPADTPKVFGGLQTTVWNPLQYRNDLRLRAAESSSHLHFFLQQEADLDI